ncbi:uncharacterized protein LOC107042857 [Diachasma alloeum]|uniref:uncharacterized protein LOC107042857 n=1 Tax=Diachasma alloeum TaxID=454923 RepID=UPI0007383EA6|nr:uncharacterized protein LOC107042857 [Diachasma alloeum]
MTYLKMKTRVEKFIEDSQPITQANNVDQLDNSFPPTEENYDKAIEALKTRFGRRELLAEVYVRELLKLVLTNAVTPQGQVPLTSIFDKLKTQMRALKSLGVTTDTCTAMLYPLVESSLPEEMLRVWQRQVSTPATNGSSGSTSITRQDRLTRLMEFLEAEVENEERIAIAVGGLDLINGSTPKPKNKSKADSNPKGNQVSTAAGLLTIKDTKTLECIFCGDHEVLRLFQG